MSESRPAGLDVNAEVLLQYLSQQRQGSDRWLMLAGLQASNIRLTRPKAPGQFSLRQAVQYPVLNHPDRDVVG
jgi:hypothetical protein